MSTILALETSCDETAVAILRRHELLASEVASQTAAHQPYGGVVPEVASRNHLVHAPRLLETATRKAGISLHEVDAFAATSGPGLASSLMIGASTAKGLALGFAKPYLAINHLEGHLLSPFFDSLGEIEPNVALIVSGGHTLLLEMGALGDYRTIGRTVDDAAGEAFDKVAKMLGLPYPGGPEIERRARSGDAKRFTLPRSMLDSGDHNFSFSGLKTAVRYLLPKLEGDYVNDLCASFQNVVVEALVRKTIGAAKSCGASLVTLSGGVSCNQELRTRLNAACDSAGIRFLAAPPSLSTDNAAMIAFAAALRFEQGFVSKVSEEIDPNLALA
jgi:N6-L-threonylcarbamoyladenine synthase